MRSRWTFGQIIAAVLIVAAVVVGVLVFTRLHKVSGQVTDVTGLVTNQTARVDALLGMQLATVQGLLAQTQRLAQAQRALGVTVARTYREVHRVLARFQLLFRRTLRALRTQLPAQTQKLVVSMERGLRALLARLRKR